jgi:hypothetical protein
VAARKTAASKTAATETTTGVDAESNETTGQTRQDFGPGTGNEVPPEESTERSPSTIVNSDPNAAPLDPPADQAGQVDPPLGYQTSTTDQAYAEAAGRTIAGENHLRLVGDDGNELSADDLFDDSDVNKTYVTTKARVYEEFTYPNTERVASRLLYVPGAKVPRFQAERIKTAVSQAAEAGPVTSAASAGTGTLKPSPGE